MKIKSKFIYCLSAVFALLVTFNQSLFAMARANPDPNAPPPPMWTQLFPIAFIVLVFYFMIIRPQSRQRTDRDKLLNNIKKGDKIVTQGGLIVTVVNITGDVLDVKINDDTKAKLRRTGVAEVLTNEPAPVEAVVVEK